MHILHTCWMTINIPNTTAERLRNRGKHKQQQPTRAQCRKANTMWRKSWSNNHNPRPSPRAGLYQLIRFVCSTCFLNAIYGAATKNVVAQCGGKQIFYLFFYLSLSFGFVFYFYRLFLGRIWKRWPTNFDCTISTTETIHHSAVGEQSARTCGSLKCTRYGVHGVSRIATELFRHGFLLTPHRV